MKIKLFLVIILISLFSYAQQKETGIIKYDFENRGGKLSDEWESKRAELQFDNTTSLFFYNKLSMLDSVKQEMVIQDDIFALKIVPADEDGYQYFRNFKTKELFVRIPKISPMEPLNVLDNWMPITWELKDGNKKILGYSCKKAIGTFRGRTYKVWYTEEIPVSYGPWKLFGLPGVILKAEDTRFNFRFTATEICYPCDANVPLEKKIENKQLTIKEYVTYDDHYGITMTDKMQTIANDYMAKKGKGHIEFVLQDPSTEKDIANGRRDFSLESSYEWEGTLIDDK